MKNNWVSFLKGFALWFALAALGLLVYSFVDPDFLLRPTLAELTRLPFVTKQPLTPNDYLQRIKDSHTTLLALAGGLAGIFTLMLGYERLGQTRYEHRTDQFNKAVEQLGHKEIDVRLGGIYTLERLMNNHPDEFGARIVDLLAAYIRNRGGQVSVRFESREREIEADASLTEDQRQERLKALETQNLFEGEDNPPSLPPYSDVKAAMEVLAKRNLSKKAEENIQFNLDGLVHSIFYNEAAPLVKIYFGSLLEKQFRGAKREKSWIGKLRETSILLLSKIKSFTPEKWDKIIKANELIVSKLEFSRLHYAIPDETSFYRAIMADSDFSWLSIFSANFKRAYFMQKSYGKYYKSYLPTSFEHSAMFGTIFDYAVMPECSFSNSSLNYVSFKFTVLTGSDFRGARLNNVAFEKNQFG